MPSQSQKNKKYHFEVFEIRNNGPYRNFLRFALNYELQFKEPSTVCNSVKFDENLIGASRFEETWLIGSCLLFSNAWFIVVESLLMLLQLFIMSHTSFYVFHEHTLEPHLHVVHNY
jgi:hypothetical protein